MATIGVLAALFAAVAASRESEAIQQRRAREGSSLDLFSAIIWEHRKRANECAYLVECYDRAAYSIWIEKPELVEEYYDRLAYLARCAAHEARMLAYYRGLIRAGSTTDKLPADLENEGNALKIREKELIEKYPSDRVYDRYYIDPEQY